MSYQLEDMELIAETSKAILVQEVGIDPTDAEEGVNRFWIPLSVIEDRSELQDIGDEGCLEVETWFAVKQEWVDEE